MNRILNAQPAFSDDHFVYRTPQWLEAVYRALCLVIAGLSAYLAMSSSNIPMPLTISLLLASCILVFLALRRRPESASVYFVCDQQGIYFPSLQAKAIIAGGKEHPWLHVPWHNVFDIKIQLGLDETGNTKELVLSVLATDPEHREFLAARAVRQDLGVHKPGPTNAVKIAFSNFFHQHDRVMSSVRRFQAAYSIGQVPRTRPDAPVAKA